MHQSDFNEYAVLDALIAEITVDAYDDNEKLSSFHQAIEDELPLPADVFVVGVPVTLVEFLYDGNEQVGLRARCRREGGEEYLVSATDLVLPSGSVGARYLAAYRRWLGLAPYPVGLTSSSRGPRHHKVGAGDIEIGALVELITLSVKERAARCRLPGTNREITLRATGLWKLVPGEMVTVKPAKEWRFAGHPYLSGKIASTRIDVAALRLIPLRLEEMGVWDPEEHSWGEDAEPVAEWAKPIIAAGPRPEFEMEQVLPGEDPEDPFDDPITHSVDLRNAGEYREAERILQELCQADLRCLDAHAHLGNLHFDDRPDDAIRHYEVGMRIGELSLGSDFAGLLPWGWIDNRPFLRCMQSYGLCAWRLGRLDEVGRIFNRMLWLNPSDNQGVRSMIDDVRERRPWEDYREEESR